MKPALPDPNEGRNKRMLIIGGALASLVWLVGSTVFLFDDLKAMRQATPEEALAIRWHISTQKPDTDKSEPNKADPPAPKSQNVNDFFAVRKNGVEPFDPASRAQTNQVIMVPDWPQRIQTGTVIGTGPVIVALACLGLVWWRRRKAEQLIAQAAEAKRQREIEFKKSFAPKRQTKHYQSKNLPR